MKKYYVTGSNGSVVQTDDGNFADTVSGDFRGPGSSADECMEFLAYPHNEDVVEFPLFGDFSHAEMLAYVGA